MKVFDLYTPLTESVNSKHRSYEFFTTQEELSFFEPIARNWGLDQKSIEEWVNSPVAKEKMPLAKDYLNQVHPIVAQVEKAFGRDLPGKLVLLPSFNDFDGFARYDRGEHLVMLGIDFPDATLDYLKALTAHELSHVYRDHSEKVWSHLGKPLSEISRQEYLDGCEADEHLASEGLATLFSQALFPEIEKRHHYYYEEDEMKWCEDHYREIDQALKYTLSTNQDVWSFYGEGRVGHGSPSRVQYYWGAEQILKELNLEKPDLAKIISAHSRAASEFQCFKKRG